MGVSAKPEWIEQVVAARGGDSTARDALFSYFTPFVHAAMACHLAGHACNRELKNVFDDALARLDELPQPELFGQWLLERVHERASELAGAPGATLELLGGASATEGKKAMSRLRQLPLPTREHLALRLLEGIPGPEIAGVLGLSPPELRSDLERGMTALMKSVSGITINVAGDSYLWSLTGAPHAAVVPLENQLTGLRYDPAALSPDVTPVESSLEITPVRPPPAGLRRSEGRRQTSPEVKVAGFSSDDPATTPVGQKLVEVADHLVSENTGTREPTRQASELPVAAQPNPFAFQGGTRPAADLPAAAVADAPTRVPAKGSPFASVPDDILGAAESVASVPTQLRPQTNSAMPSIAAGNSPRSAREEDGEATELRIAPMSVLARPNRPAATPESSDSDHDWRTKVLPNSPPTVPQPQPFSLTRGTTPFLMALVFFGFFAAIAYINLAGIERGVRRGWNLVPVVVASRDMTEGTVVEMSTLSTRHVPEHFVTTSVVKPDSVAYVLNQKLMVSVQAGDPLLWSQFEAARASERLSKRIPSRARAYTLEANSLIAVDGWVQPGDHVDIIVSVSDPGLKDPVTVTRLENALVLATGKLTATTTAVGMTAEQRNYDSVSVLALPEEIEMLALIREKASYRLVLRAEADFDTIEGGKKTARETLLNGERLRALFKRRAETIQVIRDTSRRNDNVRAPVPTPARP